MLNGNSDNRWVGTADGFSGTLKLAVDATGKFRGLAGGGVDSGTLKFKVSRVTGFGALPRRPRPAEVVPVQGGEYDRGNGGTQTVQHR